MRVLISGATGLVGRELFARLIKRGYVVNRLVRSVAAQSSYDVVWNPFSGKTDASLFEGYDVVVNLAGENVASGRWTEVKKKRIRDSRVIGTQNLTNILCGLTRPPKVYVNASAVGFYGDRGDEALDEQSKPGAGFLAEVCQAWEAATQPAQQKGMRTVNLRFGIILSPKGGALAMMLLPFKMGVGGILGTGKQVMSWIVLDDAVAVLEKAIDDAVVQGPINVVSPLSVTNREFTETLGNVLHRPTVLPVPAFGARLALGEMADALLLASAKALPKKLESTGFKFAWPKLDDALRNLLSKN